MKAVVMAGGQGTRLMPLTANQPKPLMPVAGKPILYHVLRLLERHGIEEAIVTAQYHAEQIQGYLDGLEVLGLKISCVTEDTPLGTAGGFSALAERLRDDIFLVISGDALTDCNLSELIESHRGKPALVTACLAEVDNPFGFGIVTTGEGGRVDRFVEKPTAGSELSNQVNTGIYVVDPAVLDRIPAHQPTDWARDVFPVLVGENAIYGWSTNAYWEDVGTHDRYFEVQSDALTGKVSIELEFPEVAPGIRIEDGALMPSDVTLIGPLHIGAGEIGGGATLANGTILGRDVTVGAGAILDGAICHDAAYIGPGSVLIDCVVGYGAHIGPSVQLGRGAVVGAHSFVAEGTVVPEGARIEAAVPESLSSYPRADATAWHQESP